MMVQSIFLVLSLFPWAALSAPTPNTFSTYGAFQSAFNATWSLFWDYQQNSWTENSCQGSSYKAPVLWDSAVAGGAALYTGNPYFASFVTTQLSAFKNSQLGGYSSTGGGSTDIYTDDDSQTIWVYLEAYKLTGNEDYINDAVTIMSFIQSQWNPNGGGVRWSYNGDYLASISQTESALAAVKLYTVTNDEQHLEFSKQCINWVLENLQDPSDHLFYDGKDASTGNINKGKLSYTVGTAISTLSYLYSIDNNSTWLDTATDLINASASGSGAFYSGNGYWNNPLKYLYLLFEGLSDFNNLVSPNSASVWKLQQSVSSEVTRQAAYIYNYYQEGSSGLYFDDMGSAPSQVASKYNSAFSKSSSPSSNSPPAACSDGSSSGSLLTNSAAVRIFYSAWRI